MRSIQVTAVVLVMLFAGLALRLWQLQIVRGGEFHRLSTENRLRVEKVPAPRGIIYDRRGRPLVKNSPYYSIALRPEILDEEALEGIAWFLQMDTEEIERIVAEWDDPLEPLRLMDGLTLEEVAAIEARLSDYPALSIDVAQTRYYPYGDVGAHLIGYLGKLNPDQASREDFRDVPRQALVGQWGVEKMYDDLLRGVPGSRVIEVDALGNRLRKLSEEPPVKGEDVQLSIDIELQREAEVAFGNRAGALVALKPDTGEVLGLVSRPSFDPNLFSRGIQYEDWARLAEDPHYPMLNRALQSQYPPGSTFKIVTAIAALESGAVTPRTTVSCLGAIRLGRWTFRCWKRGGHGTLSLHRALVESCDVYFYTVGREAGIEAIAAYARELGLGKPAGLGLVAEKSGLIPDSEWKQRTRGEPWFPGETYNAAIGQGFVLTTPVQLARMIGTVAADGRLYDLSLTRLTEPPEPSHTVTLAPDTLRVVRDALRGVVVEQHGTGKAARSQVAAVSGKTGTAQVIRQKDDKPEGEDMPERFRDHAWFVAYAPSAEPEIALSVFVEHGGHGGEAAAPIARRAIEAYLGDTDAASR